MKLSPAERDRLVELRRAGQPYRDLAKEFGVSIDTVTRVIRHAGLPRRRLREGADISKPPPPPPGAPETDRVTGRPYGSAFGTDADWPAGERPIPDVHKSW